MASQLMLTGNAQKRFIQNSTLLSLIDPVRGEPTTYSLDRHPHDSRLTKERLQKKFLDSFALICSNSPKGSDTVSAACMEEGGPVGTVIRLASNHGVPIALVDKLTAILNDLAEIATERKVSLQLENNTDD